LLTKLFSSETRVSILHHFFSRPDEQFYLREVARTLHRDVSGVKRELDNLEKAGLLVSERRGTMKYFSVNKASPLFGEIKNIVFKTTGIQGTIKSSLLKLKGIKIAFIYGSYAKGLERRLSDINLFIVGSIHVPELNAAILSLEERLKREINYLVFDEKELKRRKKTSDPFLQDILTGKKVMLVGREDEI
jgi:predicted nucleotidyltransferase